MVGASLGGPRALATILKRLPATFPAPLVVVQHIADGFTEGLAGWLDQETAAPGLRGARRRAAPPRPRAARPRAGATWW